MLAVVAVLTTLVLIGWIIYRGVRQKPIMAHSVVRGIAYVAGVFTFAYFLSMNIPLLLKVVFSIMLGAVMIVFAAQLQRRKQGKNP